MADDIIKTPPPAPAKEKAWQYVGPGSANHQDKRMPTISNLPVDTDNPKFGTIPGVLHPEELTQAQIEYVMKTSPETKSWWVFK